MQISHQFRKAFTHLPLGKNFQGKLWYHVKYFPELFVTKLGKVDQLSQETLVAYLKVNLDCPVSFPYFGNN